MSSNITPGRKPGTPKTGGREKGTLNRLTKLKGFRQAEFDLKLEERGIDLLDETLTTLAEIDDPAERCQVLLALMPYRYAKLKPIEMAEGAPFADIPREEQIEALKGLLAVLEKQK